MRVLIMTMIFPNALEPLSSPFNRQQFAALGKLCETEVLATIPWWPGARFFGRWSAAGRLGAVPSREVIDGLDVTHPRFLMMPKIGRRLTGALYAASLLPPLIARRGRFDVVLGSWAYPDGFAAVVLGKMLGVPSVVKLHGSDINVIARMPGPGRAVRWALPRADRVLAVSRALADEAEKLGARRERLAVVPNGVDSELFFVAERDSARRELGLSDGKWIVYVGRLQREKGVIDLLDAFERIARARNDARLALVGDGPARAECEARAERIGDRVLLAGARPHSEVPRWMAAADLVTLPSWNEGTPNVLLEAQACGRPSVATTVGGIPDVIRDAIAGELVAPRDPKALADALERVLDRSHDPRAIAAAGARGGWSDSAARLHAELRTAIEARA
jgi:glycosyltransferase involved in cell wall biosynthesis